MRGTQPNWEWKERIVHTNRGNGDTSYEENLENNTVTLTSCITHFDVQVSNTNEKELAAHGCIIIHEERCEKIITAKNETICIQGWTMMMELKVKNLEMLITIKHNHRNWKTKHFLPIKQKKCWTSYSCGNVQKNFSSWVFILSRTWWRYGTWSNASKSLWDSIKEIFA